MDEMSVPAEKSFINIDTLFEDFDNKYRLFLERLVL
jgi:hypothetical protein